MTVSNVKVGEKFSINGRSYLRIDMNLNDLIRLVNRGFFVCALDLTTYKVVCFKNSAIVEV